MSSPLDTSYPPAHGYLRRTQTVLSLTPGPVKWSQRSQVSLLTYALEPPPPVAVPLPSASFPQMQALGCEELGCLGGCLVHPSPLQNACYTEQGQYCMGRGFHLGWTDPVTLIYNQNVIRPL